MSETTASAPTTRSGLPALVIANRVLLGAALAILLFYFIVYVVYAANLIRFPFDYDQGEGFELVDVLMFSRGQWPYADIETYPFYGSIYPPLYHVLLVPFAWIFGPEYWYGRLFSFLSTLVTAAAIGLAVYREGGRNNTARFIAVLSGLAFLSSTIVYHIGPLFRQHISMIMFEVLAVVVLARAGEIEDTSRRRGQLLLGFALLLMAGYTKQLAAFTALGALVFLFIRNPRRAIFWGAGFAIVGAAIFAGIDLATGGHWWTQTIVANVKDFFPHQAEGLLLVFIRLHGWLLIPALLLVLYELYFDRLSIYSVWFLTVTVLNALAAGTWGAGDSYYATSIAALCMLSGIFAARTLNCTWGFRPNYLSRLLIDPFRRFGPGIAAAGMIVIPLFYLGYARAVFHMPTEGPIFGEIATLLSVEDNTGYGFHDPDGYTTLAYAQIGHLTTQADIDAGYEIVALMQQTDGLVLSEEAGFSLAAGHDVITNPVVLMILSWVGAYDSSELVGMIEAQEFTLIVLRAQFYPAEVLQAIGEYYVHERKVRMNGFDYIILRPEP